MSRTRIPIIAVTLASTIVALLATQSLPFAVASAGQGWVHDRQAVPDDPLAGLPGEDSSNGNNQRIPSKKASAKRLCPIDAAPASNREIGDLRATLAFVKNGPTAWTCLPPSSPPDIRLRISIDGAGKITSAETVAGDPTVANAIAKKLSGKSVGPRAGGATVGVVVLKLATGRS